MFAAVVAGWFYYYNSSVIPRIPVTKEIPVKADDLSVSKIKDAVSKLGEKIQSGVPDVPESTKVYKWYDKQGKLHVSNTPPADITNVQVQEYKSDTNVIPSGKPADKTGTTGDESTGGSYKELLEQARQSRDTMEQRNRAIDNIINQ